MTLHAQYAEDLALYVLGALDANDPQRGPLEHHLRECSACREELRQLQNDAALLALSVAAATPPQRSRERFLAAVGQQPRGRAVRMRPRWWSLAPVFAAMVIALFAIMLWRENQQMRHQVEDLRAGVQQEKEAKEAQSRQEAELSRRVRQGEVELSQQARREEEVTARARKVLAALSSAEAIRFELTAAGAKPQPHGKAIFNRREGTVIVVAGNLQPLPPAKVYQLWLLPRSGAAPLPAGTFTCDARGGAVLMMPLLAPGLEAKGFAITMEPEGGSRKPTSPILLATAE